MTDYIQLRLKTEMPSNDSRHRWLNIILVCVLAGLVLVIAELMARDFESPNSGEKEYIELHNKP